MNMPGFNAEESLYEDGGERYNRGEALSSSAIQQSIVPQQSLWLCESRRLAMRSVDNYRQVRFKVGQMGSAWQKEALLLLGSKDVLLATPWHGH